MITRELDKENNILKIKYNGAIDMANIKLHLDAVSKMKLPKHLKILTEVGDSNFVFNFTDVPFIWEEFKTIVLNQETVYDAIIISNPRETALNMVFKEISKNDPVSHYKSKVFSTNEAAQTWLSTKNKT